jgi:8-oxo-dGTP pyrophosphatase MutT (NUDIX family)
MKSTKLVYCAGGIVWKDDEVLLIRSRGDGDWKFPKGHVDPEDETWEAAARREVKEETGYDTAILDFAGFTKYPVNGATKVVLYWHLAPVGASDFQPSDEIECCEWLPFRQAIDRLTFFKDKRFLLQFTDRLQAPDE